MRGRVGAGTRLPILLGDWFWVGTVRVEVEVMERRAFPVTENLGLLVMVPSVLFPFVRMTRMTEQGAVLQEFQKVCWLGLRVEVWIIVWVKEIFVDEIARMGQMS